ncbi:MAG: type 4 prepilin-like protein leader peptide-processing enzyme [Candidatus Parcubacteria bacterium]|jgi:prepilin signal peptidase PulO-like enzyme (type II secretory pathway)
MLTLFIALAVVLGLCLGSFCNVLIVRLYEGASLGGRSRCVSCRRDLAASHLVPVFSWLFLRARCAYCQAPIHWQYPAVEVAGGAIGAAAVLVGYTGAAMDWPRVAFVASFLFIALVIAVFDLRWQLVPVSFTVAAILLFVVWQLAAGGAGDIRSMVIGMMVGGGFLWLLVWVSRARWMGEGDPIVGLLVGAVLGWPLTWTALLAAFVIGGCVSAILLGLGIVRRKTPIPFVPFLMAGMIVAFFWGEALAEFFTYALS